MARTTAHHVDTMIESEFDKLDLDRDGYVEWSDYEALIGRYKRAGGVSDDDRRARALHAFYQMHWMELLRHASPDADRLSKEQFVTATRRATTLTNRFNVTEVGGHVIFDFIDGDGDGHITMEEFMRYLEGVWQIDAADAKYAFEALDRDGANTISRDEFVGGIHEHLQTSTRTGDS
jgi:Ca2+-binding EF-hand superfamily protein